MSKIFTEGRPSNLNGWQVEVWVSKGKSKYPMGLEHVGFNKEDALAFIDGLGDRQYMINLSAGWEVYEIDRKQLEELPST